MVPHEEVDVDVRGGMIEDKTKGKTKANYFVTNVIEVKTNEGEGLVAKLFYCSICLNRENSPILTCCGHLFYWSCFLTFTCDYLKLKEYPVCNLQDRDYK